jgi:deazaflavin-dependent oxidoreductase (nitroreductase family)
VGSPQRRNRFDRLRGIRRVVRPVEAVQVRWFGRSALSTIFRTEVLVLHTTGRRSGRERATPLAYLRDGDGSLLVVGGAGGQTRLPDWVANLRADRRAAVTVDRRRVAVTAIELEGDDRSVVWPRLEQEWPQIASYQRRAGRLVPVFRLTPTEPEVSDA